jgi:hypothetical protein
MSGGIGKASRSFTYALPRPSNRYQRLLSVIFTHNYYTQSDGLCADFSVVPTEATSQLMASLGLILKNEATGFSVLYQPENLDNLISYLRREAQDVDAQTGFWTRMTFLMLLTNPEFVGVTALPIQTKQSLVNLFGCNLQAHPRDSEAGGPAPATGRGVAMLAPGSYMGGDALRDVVGSDVTLVVPPDTRRVIVTDLSGQIVIPAPGADDVTIFDGATPDDPKRTSLDFTSLPNDFYTISLEGEGGEAVGAPVYPREVLYVPAGGDTMVLLDLLFTQPEPKSGGIYPIPPLFDGDPRPVECGRLTYQLAFDARRTYWQYYVVSQVPGSRLRDMEISGPDAEFAAEPDPVRLPDGSFATLFTTRTLLPLREKSAQRFRLEGRRRDVSGHENAISVTRLPVAPAAPVWPGPAGESATGTSEMFVYV